MLFSLAEKLNLLHHAVNQYIATQWVAIGSGCLDLQDSSIGGPAQKSSAASAAVNPQVQQSIASGIPLPPAYIFPDTPVGNAAMCRFVAWLKLQPQDDEPTHKQTAKQAAAINTWDDPNNFDLYDAVANITAPVLVIAGSQDLVTPLVRDMAIAEHIPGASFVQFANAGHAVLLQHETVCAAMISAFLDADASSDDESEDSAQQL